MKSVSGKRFAKILERKGWVLKKVAGSQHVYYNPGTKQIASVPVHGSCDLKRGLLHDLMKLAGLTEDDL